VVFAAATVFFLWLFVYEIESRHEIRTGTATYAALTAVTAYGLWKVQGWGRSIALLVTLATAGIGTLTLLSVIISRDGSPVVPVIVLVASVLAAFVLSRRVFVLPHERPYVGGGGDD
jgi:uncharacterized membrane protein (DUF2068 family)